jgi:hypothetical protein
VVPDTDQGRADAEQRGKREEGAVAPGGGGLTSVQGVQWGRQPWENLAAGRHRVVRWGAGTVDVGEMAVGGPDVATRRISKSNRDEKGRGSVQAAQSTALPSLSGKPGKTGGDDKQVCGVRGIMF